jgi:ribosomal protection tetracycline resistance protein
LSRNTLNLGILAHVDAGKTTLTERLLHAAGVIETVGSVDKGTTQTDSLALERERGITIKSAVVSFAIEDVVVNLIDTPGHPDFIAEVERVLGVLDGVVLVVSAVEGVQPQTRLLMRALQRLALPTLLFVNKIDRLGASPDATLASIRKRLTDSVIPLGSARHAGTRMADFAPFGPGDPEFVEDLATDLAPHQAGLLSGFGDWTDLAYGSLRCELARQTKASLVHPLLFGSALTGAGISPLKRAIVELLPSPRGDREGPLSGTVFKVERSFKGEKLAYVRLFSGTLRVRERACSTSGEPDKVTAIAVFAEGSLVSGPVLEAGQIGKISGLKSARIGDVFGDLPPTDATAKFAPPTLTTRVAPLVERDGPRLVAALSELAEQDPLIGVRHDRRSGEISVSLYGEVQREVIQAVLERDYGLSARFDTVTPLYIERPKGHGKAVEVMHGPRNPFDATIGFRVEPGAAGSGLVFRLAVNPWDVPLHLYTTVENFAAHVEAWVSKTLSEGLYGWEVTDCIVTMDHCLYGVADGPPSRRGNSSPSDFRYLTPIVLMEALRAAGSVVCEPLVAVTLELPADSLHGALAALRRAGASIEEVSTEGELSFARATLTSEEAVDLQRSLPALTGGEGLVDSAYSGYRPRKGSTPQRQRTTVSPLDRPSYLARLGRHI